MTYYILNIILPLIYLGIFSWIIIQWKWFTGSVFSVREVLAIFYLKTFWCVVYGVIYQRAGYSDTFDMFIASEQIFRSLFRDPRDFFQLVFLPNNIYFTPGMAHYIHSINMYGTEGSYFLLRFHALVRFFSFGSYYVHAVFFSFATLPGVMMLLNYFLKPTRTLSASGMLRYRQAQDDTALRQAHHDPLVVSTEKKSPLNYKSLKDFCSLPVIALLFLPGIAFWCNGIHKEAVVVFSFGLIFQFAGAAKPTAKNYMLLIIGILLLGIMRPLFLLVFTPFLIAITLKKIFNYKAVTVYIISAVIIFISILSIHKLHLSPDFISIINKKSDEFKALNKLPQGKFSFWFFIINWVITGGLILYFLLKRGEIATLSTKGVPIAIGVAMTSIMILASSLIGIFLVTCIVSGYGALSRYDAPLMLLLICSAATARKRERLTL